MAKGRVNDEHRTTTIDQTPFEAGGYSGPEVLVTTGWVAAHTDDPDLRIVEVDIDTLSYEQGHIPAAVGWSWQKELKKYMRRDGDVTDRFEQLMSRSGIGNQTTVILYGNSHNWFATYAYWLLKHYGHADVRLLEGGRARWLAEGRPLTTAVLAVPRAAYRAREPNQSSGTAQE